MTKVARLFEEEKIIALNEQRKQIVMEMNNQRIQEMHNQRVQLAKRMLADGEDMLKVLKYSEITPDEIDKIQS